MSDGGRAANKAKVPAIGLIVTGSLSLVGGLVQVAMQSMRDVGEEQRQIDQMRGEGMDQFADVIELSQQFTWFVIAYAFIAGLIVLFGAIKMSKLQSRGWGYASAIVSMTILPNCCCVLGLVFGIWALVVLSDESVKQLFSGAVDTPQVFD